MRNKGSELCTEARTEGLRLQYICAIPYLITRLRILCILHIAYVKEHHVYTYTVSQSCTNNEICTSLFTRMPISESLNVVLFQICNVHITLSLLITIVNIRQSNTPASYMCTNIFILGTCFGKLLCQNHAVFCTE